jgi:hypothetical protein
VIFDDEFVVDRPMSSVRSNGSRASPGFSCVLLRLLRSALIDLVYKSSVCCWLWRSLRLSSCPLPARLPRAAARIKETSSVPCKSSISPSLIHSFVCSLVRSIDRSIDRFFLCLEDFLFCCKSAVSYRCSGLGERVQAAFVTVCPALSSAS